MASIAKFPRTVKMIEVFEDNCTVIISALLGTAACRDGNYKGNSNRITSIM